MSEETATAEKQFTQYIGETPEVVINGVFIKVIAPMQQLSVNEWKHLNTLLLIVDKKYFGTMIKLPDTGWVVMKKYTNSKQWREVGFPRRVPPQQVIELVESVFYSKTDTEPDEQPAAEDDISA